VRVFVPRGYRRLKDIRKEVGHNKLRQQLASGERSAFTWNPQDEQNPIQPISADQWLIASADEIIRGGKIEPAPLLLQDALEQRRILGSAFAAWVRARKAKVVLIADVVGPKVTPFRVVNKGGRPPGADWEAVEQALRIEVKARGFPEPGNKDWETQADVERWVANLLQHRKEEVGDTRIRDHVREIIAKLRTET
jgi:hypothetical protein